MLNDNSFFSILRKVLETSMNSPQKGNSFSQPFTGLQEILSGPKSSYPESHSYFASLRPYSEDFVCTLAFVGTAGGPQTVIKNYLLVQLKSRAKWFQFNSFRFHLQAPNIYLKKICNNVLSPSQTITCWMYSNCVLNGFFRIHWVKYKMVLFIKLKDAKNFNCCKMV